MAEQKNNKNLFLGLTIGLAAVVLIGVGIFIGQNEKWIAALKPLASENTQEQGADNKEIQVADKDNINGNVSAPIIIVEFSDFKCSYCLRFHQTMMQIVEDYPDKVAWVYRHFPLDSIHSQARPAAEASECAAEQDKFWEFSDGLFKNQSKLSSNLYKELALELGLNETQFKDCVSSRKYKDKVNEDQKQGIAMGVTGTPGSFLNDQPLGGAVSYENLKSIIDNLLEK